MVPVARGHGWSGGVLVRWWHGVGLRCWLSLRIRKQVRLTPCTQAVELALLVRFLTREIR